MSGKTHADTAVKGPIIVVPCLAILAVHVIATRAWPQHATNVAGFPRFDRVLLLEETSETSANVSIGDLNGDGHPDIVLAKGRHWPLVNRVLFNDGHGRFSLANDLSETSDRSYSAVLADIDGDAHLDIVVSNDRPDPKLAYLNDGRGNFRLGSTYGSPQWPTRNASVSDLDGDGLPDIIVANRSGSTGSNYICFNQGGGKFGTDCMAVSQEPATTITPADFNRDASVDLAVPHRNGGQGHVYMNDGRAGFSERIPFGPPDAAFRMVVAADLDGDGFLDIVAIDDQRRRTSIHFNERGRMFSPGPSFGERSVIPYALATGDLNLDGKIDVVVGYIDGPPTIYFNDGSGRRYTPVQFGDTAGAAYGFAIGDLNGDGFPDIALARSGAPNVVYFGSASSPRDPTNEAADSH